MALQLLEHPALSLAQGHGPDLPQQAARARAAWVAGHRGRPPSLMLVLLWARQCPDVVQVLDHHLDALFADYACTPEGWSEVQAARQVLAALNLRLYKHGQAGARLPELSAGLVLAQDGQLHFLQAGAVGLARVHRGVLEQLPGHEGGLGAQPELAVVQHSLPLRMGEPLLLAPQPLLQVADLQRFQADCAELAPGRLGEVLEPLLAAPGAAAVLLPGAADQLPAPTPGNSWPAVVDAAPGLQVDGWTLQAACAYGPPGRLFRARDDIGREALLWLAEGPADEAFWQREWVLRRSPVASLPQVLSPHRPRRHAFLLFEPPPAGVRSLADWIGSQGPLPPATLVALLCQLIEAVRALQRRGMQGLWLNPRQILVGDDGRVLLLPEFAAILPGVQRQSVPAQAVPLAPELRHGRAADGSADQFALAALCYWMLSGQWPEVARPEGGQASRYVPLASFRAGLPEGWDGVLARALAPQARARFEALSEFQLALERALQAARQAPTPRDGRKVRLALAGLLAVPVVIGLWWGLGL